MQTTVNGMNDRRRRRDLFCLYCFYSTTYGARAGTPLRRHVCTMHMHDLAPAAVVFLFLHVSLVSVFFIFFILHYARPIDEKTGTR